MSEQDIDRSEAATPFKLQKAREEGQAARSREVVSCAVFLAAMAFVPWHGIASCEALLRVARRTLVHAGSGELRPESLWPLLVEVGSAAAGAVLPFFVPMLAAAVLASVAQTGPVFSFAPLKVDFTRLHPATGWKRVFSVRALFDAARACVKLALLGVAAVLALRSLAPQFPAIAALHPAEFLRTAVADVASLGLRMGCVLAVVAVADLVFTRREFLRRIRMSRRELKDEYRHREGDPRIRARLRELRRELLKRSAALRNTRSADVVLTNPTHYAVALRYVHGEMDAPRVVAKGAGQLAAAMREIAARHRVVVVQNPPLARRLFREAALDEYIPASFHAEVARIIVWVLAARQRRAGRPAGAAA